LKAKHTGTVAVTALHQRLLQLQVCSSITETALVAKPSLLLNKDIEILKKNQSEMNSSVFQIKISIESLANRVDQVENRVSRTEDKY
jgi:hypothetical protein